MRWNSPRTARYVSSLRLNKTYGYEDKEQLSYFRIVVDVRFRAVTKMRDKTRLLRVIAGCANLLPPATPGPYCIQGF